MSNYNIPKGYKTFLKIPLP